PDHPQRQREEERQAPAPLEKLLLTDHRRNQHHNAGAQHEPGDRAEVEPAAEKPALAVRGVFGDEDRRAGVFATDRKALGHLRQQQQDRRPDANRLIRGDKADGKGAQRHDHDGGGEHFLPSVLVADGPEKHAANGADQERHREGRQRGNHLHAGVGAGEEDLAQCIGHEAVDAEVEPFHCVAQGGGGDGLPHLGVVDDSDVLQPDRVDGLLA
nr:hypothetical protein [Tanacetum cinerariifolium]